MVGGFSTSTVGICQSSPFARDAALLPKQLAVPEMPPFCTHRTSVILPKRFPDQKNDPPQRPLPRYCARRCSTPLPPHPHLAPARQLAERSPMIIAAPALLSKPVAALAAYYTGSLIAAPLATNCLTSACLSVVSDAIAQQLGPGTAYDVERAGWIFVWGVFVSGLLMAVWLTFLANTFPRAATSGAQLIGKVFVNQVVMSPTLNGGFFTFAIWTREAPRLSWTPRKRELLKAKIRRDLPPTIARSCAFWVCVQSVNFGLVPSTFNLLVNNIAFLIWMT